ncbi:MAG: hypothetical protein KKG09_06715 [Verrucomicrobia bacterium]|nr:hypothetical protein [Verrucomicrobiota bacterium]MCG2681017.1 hypothetical protein [Kiritimatiellia bacterium]MBU4247797.1 hypothetical protein [Verrucomicrobiota bacterium]MBU4292085.1 hypothetical protein [Verrucomicrobiota bacterium]MBU4428909.1 hypothetical protein [Verrucomicrobiota bacterium]
MKNNIPSIPKSVTPLNLKLLLIGGSILVMVMLVLTVRSIIGALRSSSSLSAAIQPNTETIGIHPKPPAGTLLSSASDNLRAQTSPNLAPVATPPFSVPENHPAQGALPVSVPENSQTASSPSSQPATFAEPNEIREQRKKARIASLEALQRHLELDAPFEIREQREKQRKAIIEAAKKELLEQAGTSGVPKEVIRDLEHSNPMPY